MPDVIKQAELRQYRDLADEARKVTASQEALRKTLIARIQEGAEVQPGKLSATLTKSEAQRFHLTRWCGYWDSRKLKI